MVRVTMVMPESSLLVVVVVEVVVLPLSPAFGQAACNGKAALLS
jgi:hypothetical protein